MIAEVVNRSRGRAIAIFLLVLGGLQISATPSGSLEQAQDWNILAEEPITPVPEPPSIDPLKIRLGERLFGDPRLSHDNSRSCSSCHDLGTNGATTRNLDVGRDGSTLSLNTLTLFNAALNFRFGWEGKLRTLELDAKATLENPRIMAASMSELVEKFAADPDMLREFTAAYGGGPDAASIVDAIVSFERTLVTPGSRFDRWLAGDAAALSTSELEGYRLFNRSDASPVTRASISAAIFSSGMEYSIRWRRRSLKSCACPACGTWRRRHPIFTTAAPRPSMMPLGRWASLS